MIPVSGLIVNEPVPFSVFSPDGSSSTWILAFSYPCWMVAVALAPSNVSLRNSLFYDLEADGALAHNFHQGGEGMRFAEKERQLGGVMLLILTALLAVDIVTPHGFTNHVLYAAVVLMATASSYVWMPSVVAGIGTVLTIVGMFASPETPGLPMWMPLGNRVFTIAVLWVLVWFAWKRRQAELALKRVNESLEDTIAKRTRELEGVNQALVTEITERMQTQQAFWLSEGRLAGILDIAEDAIIVTDRDRSITLFNQGAAKLFGYDPTEVLGKPIDLILPDRFLEDGAHNSDAFAQAPKSARRMAHRREVFGLKKNGREFPAEASISKLAAGETTTFTVILRDISDRLRTERQLESLAAELMTAQEEERRRISRELHDDINQRLALLAIEMGNMLSDPAAMTGQARETAQLLAQRLALISDDVRRIAYEFHSSRLDDLGLTAALKQLAEEWSAKTGIKMVLVQEEMADPLPHAIASCLYRVTQESLANVMKHARAARVELELTCDDQEVTLSISDTGVGFDFNEIQARPSGLGLVNMRERVRAVRGRLDIQSEPDRGTHITIQVPLSGASHEETTSSSGR
jgi:PAS domain S-box-containing protein